MNNQSKNSQAIADIQIDAEEIFGSVEKAINWFNAHNLALNATPISLLKTDAGITEVQQVLNAIKYGGVV